MMTIKMPMMIIMKMMVEAIMVTELKIIIMHIVTIIKTLII